MVNIPKDKAVINSIAYHDYVIILCNMDAEWTRRKECERYSCGYQKFAAMCNKYRLDIENNYKEYCLANNETGRFQPLQPYLYSPMHFLPFGHADDLAIVLLDDFDSMHFLLAEMITILERGTLAFCPTLESIGVETDEMPFCEPHILFDSSRKNVDEIKNSHTVYKSITHESQKETPLFVFTKFKMHGLGVLGHGLLFQHLLYKAMVAKIRQTIADLNNATETSDSVQDLIINKTEINSLKCSFLDLQCSEEIGTLMFCQNYSVAITLVAALRTLTFGNVFVEAASHHIIDDSEIHRLIIRLSQGGQNAQSSTLNALKDNHVFRWTHSLLATSPEACFNPETSNCRGYVAALPEFIVSPGHHAVAVKESMRVDKNIKAIQAEDKYYYCQVGTGDLMFSYSSVDDKNYPPLTSILSVLSLTNKNRQIFAPSGDKTFSGRHVVDMSTNLIVPIPKTLKHNSGGETKIKPLFPQIGDSHYPSLALLKEIRDRLCYSNPTDPSLIESGKAGRLNIGTKLKKIPRKYGIPVSLRRSIEFLYQNFAILIADPFLFDVVLDLYDTFATLHAVLTEHLPAQLQSEALDNIDNERIKQISLLVDAIHNALTHRMLGAYPDMVFRDMAIDFRGGLNQIMHTADVPVKCGLGLLRKYVMPESRSQKRDTIGSLTHITYTPGIKCCALNIGVEHKARLAFFEVDVPHVLHVGSYCDNLHETFHLVYEALLDNPSYAISKFKDLGLSDPVNEDRLNEIFANLMSHVFIFDNEVDKFLYYNISNYSRSPISKGVDPSDCLFRFTEFMVRLFLVVDAIPVENKYPWQWSNTWIRKSDDFRHALKRFEKMIDDYGSLYSAYGSLWNGPQGHLSRKYCLKHFKAVYPKLVKYMPDLWADVIKIYMKYLEDNSDRTYKYSSKKLESDILTSFKKGTPLIRSFYPNPQQQPKLAEFSGNLTEYVELDPLLVVCKFLKQNLPTFDEWNGKAVHLCRSGKERKVTYLGEPSFNKAKNQPWYKFQIDNGLTGMFSPVPSARQERLKKQIVMLKQFWDISSCLRARRLSEIIHDNWPEESPTNIIG
ncbi:MAG: hypothetical protein ACUZ8I_16850 [Candidatus Scalindua sp.]